MPNAMTDESVRTQMEHRYLHDNDGENNTAFLALDYCNQSMCLKDYATWLIKKDQANGTPVPVQNIF